MSPHRSATSRHSAAAGSAGSARLVVLVALLAVAVALAGGVWWVGRHPETPGAPRPSAGAAARATTQATTQATPRAAERAGMPAPVTTAVPARRASSTARPRPGHGAAAVLHAWDRARAEAYADGDVPALRRLYVPGTTAGARDAHLLRSYLRRGLRVTGLRTQLLELRVLERTRHRLRLRVTDRVARAVAVGPHGGRTVLPRDRASTNEITLVRRRHAWRVAEVRPVAGATPR
ncbi:MAG TPA: hypothetical protein VFM50_06165 [Nocardioidaceae bacterium]|nr:hypothetical protein [Nocardioidaceae bacterium]